MVEAKGEGRNKGSYEQGLDSPPKKETYRRKRELRSKEEEGFGKKTHEEKYLREIWTEKGHKKLKGTTYPASSKEKRSTNKQERIYEKWENGGVFREERWEQNEEEEEQECAESSEGSSAESSDLYEWTADDLIRAILDGVEPSRTPRVQGHLEKSKLKPQTHKSPFGSTVPPPETRRKRLAKEELRNDQQEDAPTQSHCAGNEYDSDEEWGGIAQETEPIPKQSKSIRRSKRTRDKSWESRDVQWDREYDRASNLRITSIAKRNGSRQKGARILLSIIKEDPGSNSSCSPINTFVQSVK